MRLSLVFASLLAFASACTSAASQDALPTPGDSGLGLADSGAADRDAADRDAAPPGDTGPAPRPDAGPVADAGPPRDVGPTDGPPPTADSGPAAPDAMSLDYGPSPPDGGGPQVEIGTGQYMYMPLANGDKMIFNDGPQGGGRYGGYNVWGGVHAIGVMPTGVMLHYKLSDEVTGEVYAETDRMETLQADGSGSGFNAYGATVILQDCCKAVKKAMIFHLDFMDSSGVMKTDERHVIGADECPRGLPNPTLDPCA